MKITSISQNVDFKRAYHRGTSKALPEIVVYWNKNRLGILRVGITVSKKLGNAPKRSRVRRIIRAAVQEVYHNLPSGYDVVIVARGRAIGLKSTNIAAALNKVFPL